MSSSCAQLVVLGTGFGAFNLVKNLKDDYDIIVVSPRNHFLFTPKRSTSIQRTEQCNAVALPTSMNFLEDVALLALRLSHKHRQPQKQIFHRRGLDEGDGVWAGH